MNETFWKRFLSKFWQIYISMRYSNNLNHSLQVLFLKHQELLLTSGWVMFCFQIEKNPFAIFKYSTSYLVAYCKTRNCKTSVAPPLRPPRRSVTWWRYKIHRWRGCHCCCWTDDKRLRFLLPWPFSLRQCGFAFYSRSDRWQADL